jgi:tRNA G18 (ribose-2'-O)-methylase SpoU
MAGYEIRQCTEPECGFRFPAAQGQAPLDRCPWCGGVTSVVHRLPSASERAAPPLNGGVLPFAALLDNVRSVFNVGSIFRSADGAGLHHLYLCGVTPTPAHPKLAKTALGAECLISYSHNKNAVELGQKLRNHGHTLWALETTAAAQSIFDVEAPPLPFVLVVGSEVVGVDPDLLTLCQRCISIPMAGRKQSLNVATAFGIAAVLLRHRIEVG